MPENKQEMQSRNIQWCKWQLPNTWKPECTRPGIACLQWLKWTKNHAPRHPANWSHIRIFMVNCKQIDAKNNIVYIYIYDMISCHCSKPLPKNVYGLVVAPTVSALVAQCHHKIYLEFLASVRSGIKAKTMPPQCHFETYIQQWTTHVQNYFPNFRRSSNSNRIGHGHCYFFEKPCLITTTEDPLQS